MTAARKPRPSRKRATIQDYAAMPFKGDPRPFEALGSAQEWANRTDGHFPTIFFALRLLKDEPEDVAKATASEPRAFIELADHAHELSGYYRALSELLNTASLRCLAGLARFAVGAERQEPSC